MLFVWGDGYVSNDKIPYGAHLSNPIFESYGFQDGDLITEVGDEKIIEFGSAEKRILIDGERKIKIKRNQEIISLTLNDNIIDELLKNKGAGILSELRIYNTIDSLIEGNNAIKVGFKVGDSIVGINGLSTPFFRDFRNELQKHKSQEVEVAFFRKNLLKTIKVNTNENGTIGYFKSNKLEKYVVEFKKYSIVEAIPSGIKKGTQTLTNYVKSLSLIFNKEGAKQIGGFGSIGSMFSNQWDWQRFWAMTALLSIILAFMNILPIPALDGGHVMFLIYEMISGKPPSDQFLTRAQVAGMVLLFSLLIYANGMDLYRFISG